MTQHVRRFMHVAILSMEKEPYRKVNDLRLPRLVDIFCYGFNVNLIKYLHCTSRRNTIVEEDFSA